MHKNGDGPQGILAEAFLVYLGDPKMMYTGGGEYVVLRPAQLIGELRRAFYAGSASVIDAIDEAPSNEDAAQWIILMRAEINIAADELNAANDLGEAGNFTPDPAA